VAVPGWTVQLVGLTKSGRAHYARLPLDRSFHGALSGAKVRALLGRRSTTVAALVTMDDPQQTVTQYGRYTLKVKAPFIVGNRAGR
jgi:hypothetical protein